jgi:glycosyltransferase involved in cell wall biosynthesis
MNKRKIRVLFDTPDPKLHGGPPTHLPLLEKELRKHVDLEAYVYGRRTDSETIFNKIMDRSKDLVMLRSKILKFRPDIIHHNTAFDPIAILRDVPLLWLAKRHRIPAFLKMHGSKNDLFRQRPYLPNLFRNYVLNNSAGIGVLSHIERNEYLTAWPRLSTRVQVVKNIIKPEFYSIERRESTIPSFLFISRFIEEKGIFDLLTAVPRVLKRCSNAQFIFIGSGTDASKFDEKVKEKSLCQVVRRINHIANLETLAFYASAWALIFPTRLQEGMPMVIAEAMAGGVPIVTTRTKFSQSYMEDGKHCLFIDYGSPSSIADALIRLVESPGLRSGMSKNSRQLADSFRADIVTREFTSIYKNFCELPHRAEA